MVTGDSVGHVNKLTRLGHTIWLRPFPSSEYVHWMFPAPKGSFDALIYMHRYTPSTVSTVVNEYMREYRDAEQAVAGGISAEDQKETGPLRTVLADLRDYEHDVLYPPATQQMEIALDDGVLVNYLRMARALKDCGLENKCAKDEGWDWPQNRLEPADG